VFVVGCLGDWRRAAAVLFERNSLSGNPAPSRETRKEVTSFTPTSIGGYSEGCGTLRANGGDIGGGSETLVAAAVATTQFGCVAGSLTARYDSSACADRGMNVVAQPIGFNARQDPCSSENLIGSIDTDGNTQAVAFGVNEKPDVAHCLRSGASKADKHESTTYAVQQMAVRRLTPVECERLQGFPDNYTNIPKAVDGPRYKALGNSMAVPVMHWIGKRIQMVEGIC
jgi:DNA (cytosine-5)-methyltransferase 1